MTQGNSSYPVLHRDIHNAYGALMQKATYEGIVERNAEIAVGKNKAVRPFILTRSSFVGGQKFGALWTGDNMTGIKEL